MTKMVALRRVYSRHNRKEFLPGQTFHEMEDREVRKMERSKRAMAAPDMDKPALVDLPVMKTEEAPGESKRRGRPPKYLRRDMTATDGQTGEEIPLPSSPVVPLSEEPISTGSEDESAP
jgi:hypothetical protein